MSIAWLIIEIGYHKEIVPLSGSKENKFLFTPPIERRIWLPLCEEPVSALDGGLLGFPPGQAMSPALVCLGPRRWKGKAGSRGIH